jgi:hypothetical protein
MQPHEVAGLQALAKSQGTSLTINPETGLPEAFSLGGFFRSLLPTIAGAGLSVASGGALSPLAIGLITGGVTAAATGDIKQGIMGGLGGYGGAGLGSSLQGFGASAPAANTSVNTAATAADQVGKASAVAGAGDAAVQNELAQAALLKSGQVQAANAIKPGIDFANVQSGGPGIFGNTSQATNFNTLAGAKPVVGSGANVNLSGQMSTNIPASGVMNKPTILSGTQGFEQAGTGISRAIQNPGAYADYVGGTTKALTSVGMPLIGAGLGGLERSDIYGDPITPTKRIIPTLNLNDTPSLNLNTNYPTYAQGGPVSFADGGMADPRDLPGGGTGAMQGAGLLPLDVSDINAKYGYSPDADSQPSGGMGMMSFGARQSMPSIPVPQLGLFADNDQIEAARSAYESQLAAAMSGRGGMGSTANAPQVARSMGTLSGGPAASMTTNRTGIAGLGAMGSTAATADTAPTAETSLARLNLNKQYANGGTIQSGGVRDLYGSQDDATTGPMLSREGYGLGRLQAMAEGGVAGYAEGGELSLNLDRIPSLNLGTGSSAGMGYMGGMDDTRYMASDKGFGPVFAKILSQMPQQERAQFLSSGMGEWTGIKKVPKQSYFTGDGRAVTGYAKGGYLDGPGDGMSDSIPATIEGKQPARLADGEFVIPADVVSHLGNGSTKAGSKRLYAMLDKVRHARTGNKKQGKQINPNKFMPA